VRSRGEEEEEELAKSRAVRRGGGCMQMRGVVATVPTRPML